MSHARGHVSAVCGDDFVMTALPRRLFTIVEQPRTVSQRSSEHVLGIQRGVFLPLTREYEASGGELVRIGKLRLVEVEPFLVWLKRRGQSSARVANDTQEPTDRAKLEAELGLVARAR